MTPTLRRLLTFALLAGGGVLLLVLLPDDADAPKGPILGKSQPSDSGALGMIDEETGGQTQVTLQRVEFERTRSVQLAPGRFEERPVSVISLRNGRPTPEGDLLVDEPSITFLDELTGEPEGRIQAARGRFLGMGTAVGPLRVDVDPSGPDAFVLTEDVRGELPLGGGQRAGLATAELRMQDQRVEAPGHVVLTWGAMTLTGTRMTWDGTAGLLRLERDVRIVQPETDLTPGLTLHSPGGLTWTLPAEDGDGRGWGVLHGPVTGESSTGATLSGARMELLADASTVILSGAADVRLVDGEGSRRLAAERLVLGLGADGLALSSAEGAVLLLLDDGAGRVGSLRTASLLALGDEIVAPGHVVVEQGDLSLSGRDWRWNGATRELRSENAVRLSALPSGPPAFAGARLDAAGGLHAVMPGDGGLASALVRLRGPLEGSLPDGTTLAGGDFVYDGAASEAVLAGRVVLDVPRLGARRHVEADALRLGLDGGDVGDLSARGRVVVETRDDGGPLTLLRAERVDLQAGIVLAPGAVHLTRDALALQGHDLTWLADDGRLDLARDAVMGRTDPDTGESQVLRSPGGLTWWLPAGDDPGAAGHGELHGPVTGAGDSGWTLAAARVRADATGESLDLLGDTRLVLPGGAVVSSPDALNVRRVDGRLRVDAPGPVRWTDGETTVDGHVLAWDEATRCLVLQRDIRIVRRDGTGVVLLDVRAGGPLEALGPETEGGAWTADLSGGVTGSNDAGDGLSAGRVRFDGPARTIELHDDAAASLAGSFALRARGRIRLVRDASDAIVVAEAHDDVTASGTSVAETWTAASDTLLVDRRARTANLTGRVRVEHVRDGRGTTLVTGPGGRVLAVTDALDELLHVDIAGRVTVTTEALTAEADRALFDVRDDHLVLDGNCEFRGPSGALRAPRVEIWPGQMRWKIPHSVVELPGTPVDG